MGDNPPVTSAELGIFKRKQESKKESKHAFDQEKKNGKLLRSRKKERKHALDHEYKIQEKTIMIKKRGKENGKRKLEFNIEPHF